MIVSPSILAADFGNLQRDVEMVNRSDAGMIHLDIMDGVFVPNISFGFPVVKAVGKISQKPLDVHLMTMEPQKFVSQVRDCGATIMNIHQEACIHLDRAIRAIKDAGMKPAVTINPSTPVEMLRDILPELYMVLVMSVNPGFGGQKFIPNTYNKIARLRRLIAETGSHALIEVDGGVTLDNAPDIAKAGIDVVVAGSAIFHAPEPEAVIHTLSLL